MQNLNVKVGAIINDTVGTMMAKTLEHRDCYIVCHTFHLCRCGTYLAQGLIVGTGVNACYYEDLKRVKKWEGTKEMELYAVRIPELYICHEPS